MGAMSDGASGIAQGVKTAIDNGGPLVKLFLTEPDGFGTGFAGPTFDRLRPNMPDEWSSADLLAVSLLDVNVRPRGVREILETRSANRFNDALARIPSDVNLWDSDERVEKALDEARRLFKELEGLSGVGPVTASKLLARKRPALIPIRDRVINRRLHLKPKEPFWSPLRAVLSQPEILSGLRAMRPTGFEDITELRVLDIALWMLGSDSGAAKNARARVGMQQ